MLKWVGMLLTIGATSGAGFWMGSRLNERRRLLKAWIAILEILKSAIGYQELLPEIFQKLAVTGEESGFDAAFKDLAEQIAFGSEYSVTEMWNQMIARPEFGELQPTDKDAIKELGLFLGSSDRTDQAAKISICQEKLKLNLIHAEEDCDKRIGIYRYLGFASGALVVLLLV